MNTQLEKLVRFSDVCESLDVSPPTLRRWIAAGQFPQPLRVGRTIRFPTSTVVQFIRQRQTEPTMLVGGQR